MSKLKKFAMFLLLWKHRSSPRFKLTTVETDRNIENCIEYFVTILRKMYQMIEKHEWDKQANRKKSLTVFT